MNEENDVFMKKSNIDVSRSFKDTYDQGKLNEAYEIYLEHGVKALGESNNMINLIMLNIGREKLLEERTKIK